MKINCFDLCAVTFFAHLNINKMKRNTMEGKEKFRFPKITLNAVTST